MLKNSISLPSVSTLLSPIVARDSYHTKLDDKSGFDHFLLSEDSLPYMGAEWGGWWLVWKTLPQGWRESPYVYQTLGQVATHMLRNYGIPCSQYIDDHHLGELWGTQIKRNSSFDAANCAFFVAGTLLTQLGYFLHLAKCVPIPKQQLIFLGHLVDTVRQAFSIPEEKKSRSSSLCGKKSCLSSKSPSTCCNVSRENVSLLP